MAWGGVCLLFREGGRRLESQKLKPEGAAWLVFEKKKKCQGWGAVALRKMGEDRFRVFVFFFLNVSKMPPPLNVLRNPAFIGKMLLGFSTWSLNFFLFVNFDFSYFFVFF